MKVAPSMMNCVHFRLGPQFWFLDVTFHHPASLGPLTIHPVNTMIESGVASRPKKLLAVRLIFTPSHEHCGAQSTEYSYK